MINKSVCAKTSDELHCNKLSLILKLTIVCHLGRYMAFLALNRQNSDADKNLCSECEKNLQINYYLETSRLSKYQDLYSSCWLIPISIALENVIRSSVTKEVLLINSYS